MLSQEQVYFIVSFFFSYFYYDTYTCICLQTTHRLQIYVWKVWSTNSLSIHVILKVKTIISTTSKKQKKSWICVQNKWINIPSWWSLPHIQPIFLTAFYFVLQLQHILDFPHPRNSSDMVTSLDRPVELCGQKKVCFIKMQVLSKCEYIRLRCKDHETATFFKRTIDFSHLYNTAVSFPVMQPYSRTVILIIYDHISQLTGSFPSQWSTQQKLECWNFKKHMRSELILTSLE